MRYEIELRGLGRFDTSLAVAEQRVNAQTERIVRENGQLLTTKIKANASGRPGPNVVTGDYRRSWTTVFSAAGGVYSSTSGTNRPQGRRLEAGFTGVDSLGRYYDQPPYPHVEPAVNDMVERFLNDLRAITL